MRIPLRNKLVPFALSLTLLLTPLAAARASAAGGEVTGTVTDPKGAVVVGASVAVVDAATGATVAAATTDGQGKYSLPGVPAGTYAVVVKAQGFREARQEQVKVEEGKRAAFDFKLEIALAETTVTVGAEGLKPNTDPVYTQLRQQGESPQEFAGDYAQVNGLVIKRDAATFTLRSGELYFLAPVGGGASPAPSSSATAR